MRRMSLPTEAVPINTAFESYPVPDSLQEYRRIRSFDRTPEPSGEAGAGGGGQQTSGEAGLDTGRFVVQEHHARRLHWDLRIERHGVLVSWAVPKGFPADTRTNHLAVHTEDHPLEYLDFAGEIPRGNYGAGHMSIWDSGTYVCHEFSPRKVVITLVGRRIRGRYALFQTNDRNWLLHRMDVAEGAQPSPMPKGLRPMLAKPGGLPAEDGAYGFEIKWDGIRAVLYADPESAGRRWLVQSRNQNDLTAQYPELAPLAEALDGRSAVLDCEIVTLTPDGRPSFGRLQGRMGLASPRDVRDAQSRIPATAMLFDLLYLDGLSLMEMPYRERRRRLEDLALHGPHWQTPGYHIGDGRGMLAATRERGLEGLMAKRLESTYEVGKRTGSWIKIKNVRRQDLVIGGWLPGTGNRWGTLGALLVGYYEADGEDGPSSLHYAGRVGTGFTQEELGRLLDRLLPLQRASSPFVQGAVAKGAVYVEPRLVGEFAFTEWTRAKTLRHPVYKGLRIDKEPEAVVREEPA